MGSDAMLEGGWPAHYAVYEGRGVAEIWEELIKAEDEVLRHETPETIERYEELVDELTATPWGQDELRRQEARRQEVIDGK